MEGTGTKTVRDHAGNVQRVIDALARHGVEMSDDGPTDRAEAAPPLRIGDDDIDSRWRITIR